MAPDHHDTTIIVVLLVTFTLATAACVLRLVARARRRTEYDLSDFFAVIGWVLLLALVVQLIVWTVIGGLGDHVDPQDHVTLRNYYVLFYINQITYFALCPVIKLSIMLFYRRIFPTPEMRLINRFMVCCLSAWGIANVSTGVFQCTPIARFWEPSLPGTCINLLAFLYGVQVPNIVFDFVLLFVPIPFIWNIQRSARDRMALIGLFSLGGLGCVSGLVRIVMLGKLDEADIPYSSFNPAVWTSVEPSVALVCSCLPIIRGLFTFKPAGLNSRSSFGRAVTKLRMPRHVSGHRVSPDIFAAAEIGQRDSFKMGPYKILKTNEITITSEQRHPSRPNSRFLVDESHVGLWESTTNESVGATNFEDERRKRASALSL